MDLRHAVAEAVRAVISECERTCHAEGMAEAARIARDYEKQLGIEKHNAGRVAVLFELAETTAQEIGKSIEARAGEITGGAHPPDQQASRECSSSGPATPLDLPADTLSRATTKSGEGAIGTALETDKAGTEDARTDDSPGSQLPEEVTPTGQVRVSLPAHPYSGRAPDAYCTGWKDGHADEHAFAVAAEHARAVKILLAVADPQWDVEDEDFPCWSVFGCGNGLHEPACLAARAYVEEKP